MRYLLAILAFLLFCTSMTTAQTAAILSPSVLCTNRPPFLLFSSWFPLGFLLFSSWFPLVFLLFSSWFLKTTSNTGSTQDRHRMVILQGYEKGMCIV